MKKNQFLILSFLLVPLFLAIGVMNVWIIGRCFADELYTRKIIGEYEQGKNYGEFAFYYGNFISGGPPTYKPLASASGVRDFAVDSKGNIYLTNPLNRKMIKINGKGKVEREYGIKEGLSFSPHEVEIDGNDNVYVTDQQKFMIYKFDAKDDFVWRLGGEDTANGEFRGHIDLYVNQRGNMYAEGWGKPRKFTSDGKLLGVVNFRREYYTCALEDSVGNIYAIRQTSPGVSVEVTKYAGKDENVLSLNQLEIIGKRTFPLLNEKPYPAFGFRLIGLDNQGNLYLDLSTAVLEEKDDWISSRENELVARCNFDKKKLSLFRPIKGKDTLDEHGDLIRVDPHGNIYQVVLIYSHPARYTSGDKVRIYKWEKVNKK